MAQGTGTTETQTQKTPWVRRALVALGVLVGLGIAGFLVWALTPLGPEQSALDALESDATVVVAEVDGGWMFTPQIATGDTGLVLYPGGRVDPRSYAPLARDVAEQGFTVALASMPLNLAVFDPDRAEELMDGAEGVSRWAVGGHSLGGAMAAVYAAEDEPRVGGLVLLAAYPSDSTDLSSSGLATLSAVGDADQVVDSAVWEQARVRLPADTKYAVIEGGNHSGFGEYGDQPGDGEATISPAEQQEITAGFIAELLSSLE